MGPATPHRSQTAIERTVREERGYVLASLVGFVRDMELAEDVLQDAVVAALEHWPDRGVPENPRAWLVQTARRRAIDLFRRDARFQARQDELKRLVERDQAARRDETEAPVVDERLCLMFTCSHPALGEQARVALTLRTLGGLTTTEIARAFLVPETTMAQRLVRAKRKIKAANIPFRIPPDHLWPERIDSILSVLYFIFNEGYSATSGRSLTRSELADEAIRLTRVLVELAPREPEALGLLALMLLHHSRRAARTDEAGDLVTLENQDRSVWDHDLVGDGKAFLNRALAMRCAGPYQIQAAISAVHADAPSYAETDWCEITGLYRRLHDLQPSWVVKLNEIVALSFASGPEAGLTALGELEDQAILERYQPFHAARADLLRRAGRTNEAVSAYARALDLTDNAAEQRFLRRRIAELAE